MKSVIAQGSTVGKAIEEALKKANAPQEFYIKLLEDAQSGFLGFGSKKAKIALFFKQEIETKKNDPSLSSDSYQTFFNNPSIKKQIDDLTKTTQESNTPSKSTHHQRPVSPDNKKNTATTQQPVQNKPQALHTRPLIDKKRAEPNQKNQDLKQQPQNNPQQNNQGHKPQNKKYYKPRNRFYRPKNQSTNSNPNPTQGQTQQPDQNIDPLLKNDK